MSDIQLKEMMKRLQAKLDEKKKKESELDKEIEQKQIELAKMKKELAEL